MGGHIQDMLYIWQLPWLALAAPFLTLLAQMHIETTPLSLLGTISGSVGSFQLRGALASWRALTIESSLMIGYG